MARPAGEEFGAGGAGGGGADDGRRAPRRLRQQCGRRQPDGCRSPTAVAAATEGRRAVQQQVGRRHMQRRGCGAVFVRVRAFVRACLRM